MDARSLSWLVLVGWTAPALCSADDVTALPEGEGKQLLVAYCSACHVLEEVTKFKGYYDEEQWREVVLTMAAYGTPVPAIRIPILVEYLAENLGPQTRESR